MGAMNDRVLTALFRRFCEKGDGRALAAVFDATSKELLELACHLVRDPSEAEDLVQAAFLTAIAKSERYDGRSPVQAWLYGILWREAAKTRRRSARRVDPQRLGERSVPDPSDTAAEAEVP
jgi:DNA-directed RNA polymerase specialized sigma24 family protein